MIVALRVMKRTKRSKHAMQQRKNFIAHPMHALVAASADKVLLFAL
jgi:hypothetical protein